MCLKKRVVGLDFCDSVSSQVKIYLYMKVEVRFMLCYVSLLRTAALGLLCDLS